VFETSRAQNDDSSETRFAIAFESIAGMAEARVSIDRTSVFGVSRASLRRPTRQHECRSKGGRQSLFVASGEKLFPYQVWRRWAFQHRCGSHENT
jgi:hypothetical protein